MTWSVISPQLSKYQAIDETSTTQQHPLGMRVQAVDEGSSSHGVGEFIYCKGVASTVVADWVTIDPDDWTTVRLVANAVGPVGIAMSANVANQYGWYQIYGKAHGYSGADIADNTQIYIHGTAGQVDDAVVDGDMVHNALSASTITGAVATGEFTIWYPYTDNIASND